MTSVEYSRLVNTDKLKTEIAAKLSVSEVAERLCDVELIASGHQSKGLCPIHGEDTPSFHVNDSKNVYHCFGCKEGGDSIDLVQKVHHVGYREALAILAKEAEIDIKEYERQPTAEEKANDELRAWCEKWINGLNHDKSRTSIEIAKAFGAKKPDGAAKVADIPKYLTDKHYLFRGEVTFPYRTANGRLVGWKTRAEDKKMFMTPGDFPLMEPVVWGLDVAKPHIENGQLVLVEGEYDCMVLHDNGLQNVAAIGGSRWTDEQMAILEHHKIREVVFLLDGDEGGRTAAESIAKRLWRHNIRVRITQAWAGADPEDMIRAMGAGVVQQAVDGAQGALEWLLFQEWKNTPRETLTQKLDFVTWIQAEYGDQLIGVEETLVFQEVAKWLKLPESDVLDFARSNKTLLQAPDSEKAVLGRCVRDGKYYMDIRKRIAVTDFYVLKHQRVWKVLENMLGDGLDFDLATVKRLAENEGVENEFMDVLAATGDLNIGWHEDQVVDFSIRRQSRADADYFREVIADLNVPVNQVIGTLTHAVTSKALGRGSGASFAIAEQVDEAIDTLHTRMRNPDQVHGIDLGSQFPMFTRAIQGFQGRRLVVVGATSGRGKSTIVIQWLAGLAVHQAIPCDFISLEMDSDEILYKAASHLTGIDSMKISGGTLNKDELVRVEKALAKLRKSPFRIYAPDGITPNEMLLYCRESVMERRTELFAVDFIQQMGADPETRRLSRYEQLGEASYLMKQKICRSLDVGVICVAQLKRDAAGKEEPTPEDMGDSYEIVRASDVVVLLNENDNQQHEIWVGKNRQGPGGLLIPAVYDKPTNSFREATGGAKEPDYAIL